MIASFFNRLNFSKTEKFFLTCWFVWLFCWLLEGPIHRHDFNTAQWLLHSWWFLQEPIPSCLSASRLSCWYYPTHPPLVHLFGVPGMILFGWATWPIRLLQALLVLWGALELRSLATRMANSTAGAMAMFILLASPLMILFGAIPNYEPTVVVLLCVLMNRTSIYLQNPSKLRASIVMGIAILGMLTDWSAYHPVGVAFLIAWYGYFRGTESKWVQILSQHRWHLTGLFVAGVVIFLSHLSIIYYAYGSLEPILMIAERRSISFSFANTNLAFLSSLPKPQVMLVSLIGVVLIQFLTLSTAWIVILISRRQKSPPSDAIIGRWIIIPLSAGIIHSLMFLQGAFVHEYWVAPLLPVLALIAAVMASNWTPKQVKVSGSLGCIALLLWAFVLLPLSSVSYAEEPVDSVSGLDDVFGDESSLLVSSEIIAGRPEVVMTLHTGMLTPTHWAPESSEEWDWDGAILCSDSPWIEKLTKPEIGFTMIEQRASPSCDEKTLIVLTS